MVNGRGSGVGYIGMCQAICMRNKFKCKFAGWRRPSHDHDVGHNVIRTLAEDNGRRSGGLTLADVDLPPLADCYHALRLRLLKSRSSCCSGDIREPHIITTTLDLPPTSLPDCFSRGKTCCFRLQEYRWFCLPSEAVCAHTSVSLVREQLHA